MFQALRTRAAAAVVVAVVTTSLGTGGLLMAVGTQTASAAPPPLDHFLCYNASSLPAAPGFTVPKKVTLIDQFSRRIKPNIGGVILHCNPTTKIVPPAQTFAPQSPSWHLLCLRMATNKQKVHIVQITNQFGTAQLVTGQPNQFCLPSLKSFNPGSFTPPAATEFKPDHFTCYPVSYRAGTVPFNPPPVQVRDQFSGPGPVPIAVLNPTRLCLPTEKKIKKVIAAAIANPTMHLLCFSTVPPTPVPTQPIWDQNQFSSAQGGALNVVDPNGNELCLPSTKVKIK